MQSMHLRARPWLSDAVLYFCDEKGNSVRERMFHWETQSRFLERNQQTSCSYGIHIDKRLMIIMYL